MWLATAGDAWADALVAYSTAVFVVVVGPVGVQLLGSAAGPAAAAAHRRDLVDQWQELCDVVAVPAGQRYGQGDAGVLGQDGVLGARSGAVDRARAAFGPRLAART